MIKENALKYLGHTGQQITDEMESLLDECIREVKQVSQPRLFPAGLNLFGALPDKRIGTVSSRGSNPEAFAVQPLPLSEQLLGHPGMEGKISRKEQHDKAAVMDAVGSAYLEAYRRV